MGLRTVGGQANTWGNCAWSGSAGTAPFNATWNSPAATTTLPTVLAEDPSAGAGASIGANALGTLRLVVQVLNPTLGPTSQWGTALWTTSQWNATVGDWYDITGRVRGLSWAQGIPSPDASPEVGTATLTLNNLDGAASPWATSGEFVGGDSRPWLRVGTVLRFGMLCNAPANAHVTLAAFNPFFTGRIEDITEDTDSNVDGWVTVTVAESTADLSPQPEDQQTQDGNTVSQTILAALANVSWPWQTSVRVPREDALVPTTTLSGQSSTDIAQRLADGLHWSVVADGRGAVECVRRRISDTDSGVCFTNRQTSRWGTAQWGVDPWTKDDGFGGTLELPLVQVSPYSNRERLLNDALGGRVDNEGNSYAALEVTDTGSVAKFGTIGDTFGFPRQDLALQTDAMVTALLQRVVSLYAWDDLGVDSIQLDADLDGFVDLPAVMAYFAAYGREGRALRIRWVHPSGHVYHEYGAVVRQEHGITKEGGQIKWTATWSIAHVTTAAV